MTTSIENNFVYNSKHSLSLNLFKMVGLIILFMSLFLGINFSSHKHSPSSIRNKNQISDDYFINKIGLAIYTFKLEVENPKASVIYIHGYGDYHLRNLETFKQLNSFGISCFAIDLQGHGKSDGDRAYVENFEDLVDDVNQFITIIKSKNKANNLFLVGNSMGGAISALSSKRNKTLLDGVVFVSPMFAVSKNVAKPYLVFFSKYLSLILPKLPLVKKLDPSTYSHSKKGIESFKDPLCYQGRIKVNTGYQSILATQKIQEESKKFDLPFFIAQSGNDTTVDSFGASLFFKNSISHDKKLVVYKDTLHLLLDEPKKYSGGGKRVIEDIANWILNRSIYN